MTITLSPDLERRLQAAAAREGTRPEELAQTLIARGLTDDPTLALFAKWEREDSTTDPIELERRQREFDAFAKAINETREAAGSRRVYP